MGDSRHVIRIGVSNVQDASKIPDLPVADSVDNLIKDLPPLSPDCSIYRVPPKLRCLNEKAYTPQAASIGPYHHGKEEVKAMEEHKLRYVQAFLLRTTTTLQHFTSSIQDWEQEIRACYAERVDIPRNSFVKMVLVDACFVIEVILSSFDSQYERKMYLPKSSFLCATDMILLENQLPFFVLERLYHQAFPLEPKNLFLENAIAFLLHLLLTNCEAKSLIERVNLHIESGHKIMHFVDLLRLCQLPSSLRKSTKEHVVLVAIPRATDLENAGITLKRGSSDFTLDVKYTTGVLELPHLTIDEYAKYLLSNILVLEICHYGDNTYVRDYVFFMDMLINTQRDVDIFIKRGIMRSTSSDSSAVATLFNNVGNDFPIVSYNYYFSDISKELNKFCTVRRHRWKATLKHDYCSTPWMIASTITAIILLVLTLIQTICSVVSFVV